MKKNIFCLLLFLPFFILAQASKKKRVLFLGNSYTYVNDLPLLIKNIALANGDTLVYDQNTIGGYSFANHFADNVSKAKINAVAWNYVVLQAQSQEPAFPPGQVNSQTMPYAVKLDSLIKKNDTCTRTVFYETWGRKNGDTPNCGFYPPLCTYTGMQNRLKVSYKKFADTTRGVMSPVGEAFRQSIATTPGLELYDADQSHPSLSGSYLAACLFYELLFQRSVLSNTYNPGLAANTFLFLKQTAHETLTDSIAVWNIGTNMPWADFEATPSGSSYQFQSNSTSLSNKWYFGDGTISTLANPLHTYSNTILTGHWVSHVVTNGCSKDSVAQQIFVLPNGLNENKASERVILYPNPCKDRLYFKNADEFNNNGSWLEIRNNLGQMIYASEFNADIGIQQFENGLYFISIGNDKKLYREHFIKCE